MNFHTQISHVRKTSFYQLKRLQACKHYIPSEHLSTLVHAFITSRLDFCNSLYYALPKKSIARLQNVQNACAKFLTGARKSDSAGEQLNQLHWLPIQQRIMFKLNIFSFHICYQTPGCPEYFEKSISKPIAQRMTRRSLEPLLVSDFKPRLKSYGDRCFTVGIPLLFNALPLSIRQSVSLPIFKSKLKIHLFPKRC